MFIHRKSGTRPLTLNGAVPSLLGQGGNRRARTRFLLWFYRYNRAGMTCDSRLYTQQTTFRTAVGWGGANLSAPTPSSGPRSSLPNMMPLVMGAKTDLSDKKTCLRHDRGVSRAPFLGGKGDRLGFVHREALHDAVRAGRGLFYFGSWLRARINKFSLGGSGDRGTRQDLPADLSTTPTYLSPLPP